MGVVSDAELHESRPEIIDYKFLVYVIPMKYIAWMSVIYIREEQTINGTFLGTRGGECERKNSGAQAFICYAYR